MNDSLQTAGKDANVGSQLGADAELFSGHEQHAINFNFFYLNSF